RPGPTHGVGDSPQTTSHRAEATAPGQSATTLAIARAAQGETGGRTETAGVAAPPGQASQIALRGDHATASGIGRPRTGRLPLPLWRRQGQRSHHLLRASPAAGRKLLRTTFSPDAR